MTWNKDNRTELLDQFCGAAIATAQGGISLSCQLLIVQYSHSPLQYGDNCDATSLAASA